MTELDALDRRILDLLLNDGRMTWAQLAAEIGLSAPSAAERVRKLEDAGYIDGYSARISAPLVGYPLLALVSLSVDAPGRHDTLVRWARESPEVQECHIVAGEHDYLLKVRARDPQQLESFLREKLRSVPGVVTTTTTIVLRSLKETGSVPLAEEL